MRKEEKAFLQKGSSFLTLHRGEHKQYEKEGKCQTLKVILKSKLWATAHKKGQFLKIMPK